MSMCSQDCQWVDLGQLDAGYLQFVSNTKVNHSKPQPPQPVCNQGNHDVVKHNQLVFTVIALIWHLRKFSCSHCYSLSTVVLIAGCHKQLSFALIRYALLECDAISEYSIWNWSYAHIYKKSRECGGVNKAVEHLHFWGLWHIIPA